MESAYPDMRESEKQVADYLDELGLWWTYESPVFVYDEKERPRVWTPDFYIPKLGMYIEVSGTGNFARDYEYRDKIYKSNSLNVIFVQTYKGEKMWRNFLIKRIIEIEEQRHHEIMKMINFRVLTPARP